MKLENFRFEKDKDGIVVLTWDMPGRSMNVITEDVINELNLVVDEIITQSSIKGCVIASGKMNFSAGADLNLLSQGAKQYEAVRQERGEEAANILFFENSRKLSILYRKLEACGKPFVATINGVCLGGAFELALACHYRIMSSSEKSKIGLPEIKVGLFPGAGGTQRVARLMPTGDALQFLFKGEQLKAKAALAGKLIH